MWSRVTATADEREASALARMLDDTGATTIAAANAGEEYTLAGVLASVTVHPVGTTHGLDAELFDGTGRVRLVWLGRERIPGIDPGRCLSIRGRVVHSTGHALPTVFNPRYTLLANGPA
jgi:hypothetical protein